MPFNPPFAIKLALGARLNWIYLSSIRILVHGAMTTLFSTTWTIVLVAAVAVGSYLVSNKLRTSIPVDEAKQHATSAVHSSENPENIVPGDYIYGPVTPTLADTSSPECIVCNGEPGDSDFSLVVPTLSCRHARQVCGVCIRHIIRMFVTSGEYVEGIPCPSTGCPQKLRYYDVEKWASPAVFERFDKSLLQDHLRTGKRYVRCIARGCPAGQEHTGKGGNTTVVCHSCGAKQCFYHQVPWHEGFACEQWDTYRPNMVRQSRLKGEKMSCPKCKRQLVKEDGYDRFTCGPQVGCGYQFCWECLVPWSEVGPHDHSRHYDNCKYYSGAPGKNPAPPDTISIIKLRRKALLPPPKEVLMNPEEEGGDKMDVGESQASISYLQANKEKAPSTKWRRFKSFFQGRW